MKTASIFCSAISCCAFAIRARRSSSAIGTMPAVIGLSAWMEGGTAARLRLRGHVGARAAARADGGGAGAERGDLDEVSSIHWH